MVIVKLYGCLYTDSDVVEIRLKSIIEHKLFNTIINNHDTVNSFLSVKWTDNVEANLNYPYT